MTQGTTHRTAPHKLANIAKGPSDRQKDSQTIDAWPRVATFMKIERVVKHFIHLNPRKLESERGLQTVLPKRKGATVRATVRGEETSCFLSIIEIAGNGIL